MTELRIGMRAPDFTLEAADGGSLALSSLRGRKAVLIFYPRAGTGTCTKELVDFTGLAAEFAATDAVLLAISDDGLKKLGNFAEKHALAPVLLSDPEHRAIEAYGVWVEKSMYGRRFMAVERATFLVDRGGKLAGVWRKVRVAGHAEAVLEAARALR